MKFSCSLPPSILIVDDSRDGLLVRRALLEEQGFAVQVAQSGEEGLNLFERRQFDVVVTDYRMPGMNGLDLIGRIHALKPGTPVVLLSSLVEPLGLNQENTGADAVIAKNSNEAGHLIRWVKRLINRPPARKPAASQRRASAVARARA
jgi:CheY-like chemotaxis protein